jgi:cytidylate kinase
MLKMMTAEQKAKVSDFHELIPKVQALDDSDMKRSVAPLKVSPDAIVYDNSDSPSEMQDALILQYYMTHVSEILKNTKILKEKA